LRDLPKIFKSLEFWIFELFEKSNTLVSGVTRVTIAFNPRTLLFQKYLQFVCFHDAPNIARYISEHETILDEVKAAAGVDRDSAKHLFTILFIWRLRDRVEIE
jgi:hypothetical protein